MLHEVLDLYAASVPMKPLNVKAAILQHARSDSEIYFAAGDDVHAIAAAMYYPLPAETPGVRLFELAFVCRPAMAGHLIAFVHLSHLTRARLANDGPVRVRAHVRRGHRPGARLALLCGMTLAGSCGAFDRWEFWGSPDVAIRPRHQIALHRA
jgi:hypothetical protein